MLLCDTCGRAAHLDFVSTPGRLERTCLESSCIGATVRDMQHDRGPITITTTVQPKEK